MVGSRHCHRPWPRSAGVRERIVRSAVEWRKPGGSRHQFESSALGGLRFASDFTQLWQQSAVWRQPLVPAAIALELPELQQQPPVVLERRQWFLFAALPLVLRARRQLLGAIALVLCTFAFVLAAEPQLLCTEPELLRTFPLVLRTEPHLLRAQP